MKQIPVPPNLQGHELKEIQQFDFADEQAATSAYDLMQISNGSEPVDLPNGDQLRPLTNGEVYYFIRLGKIILLLILLVTGI